MFLPEICDEQSYTRNCVFYKKNLHVLNITETNICSDFRPSTLEKVQELVRLRIYQAYAWGVPLLIMTIAIISDNLPNGDFLQPRFGQTRCGFDGK